ncbi:hypothetical protein M3P05_18730, partial [Sansalvadorimonas sp. 2012CJ34-2]
MNTDFDNDSILDRDSEFSETESIGTSQDGSLTLAVLEALREEPGLSSLHPWLNQLIEGGDIQVSSKDVDDAIADIDRETPVLVPLSTELAELARKPELSQYGDALISLQSKIEDGDIDKLVKLLEDLP